MKKDPPMAERQRRFRATHAPQQPPFLGISLREGDCHALAAGLVTDSVKQQAVEALKEFWPQEDIKSKAGVA